ncbi:hypothetical protein PUNSTDRAFT_140592 [Punctularia strigosozonata HHB-11173 SS5]|uniref:uncharacterized protein n=1 Tax=Punctularia strigosozonata (strain HHB-11173) TaxID=741275 RepID=UPI000441747D|nr:uncharacterized protein PUNSTDRAFT_140592 [Punctularia strigosozonata HHB-11173 SS5]EIN14266.1 hypothetical protein PUNSTDRAFT_140592 [Punctularia strigosozonata HHB-11173 SS5]
MADYLMTSPSEPESTRFPADISGSKPSSPRIISGSFRPTMLSLSFSSSGSKAVRAYEIERQRVKKAREFELAKEHKEKAIGEKMAQDTGFKGRRNVKDIRSGSEDVIDPMRKLKADVLQVGRSTGDEERAGKSGRKEVTLGELTVFKPGRNRGHGRGRKAKDSNFEVVPHVRAVIALDDEPDLFELDEPWEYVNPDEDENHGPSYAAVVAGA